MPLTIAPLTRLQGISRMGSLHHGVGCLLQDLRFAARQLAKQPVLTGSAALTLALGIGANTAIFSAVDAVLFRDPVFPDPGRLMAAYSIIVLVFLAVASLACALPARRAARVDPIIALRSE